MARELWLLRHGKAHRYDGVEDYDRTLKKRGKRSAIAIGEWLTSQKLVPDCVVTSPAARAYATAKVVCAEIGFDNERIAQDKRLYDEGLARFKAVLAECPDECQRVLIVGHNPELEDFLYFIADPADLPATKKPLPTAALARLSMPDDWKLLDRNCAKLLYIINPNNLLRDDNED